VENREHGIMITPAGVSYHREGEFGGGIAPAQLKKSSTKRKTNIGMGGLCNVCTKRKFVATEQGERGKKEHFYGGLISSTSRTLGKERGAI